MANRKNNQLGLIIRFILCLAFGVVLIVFPSKTIDAICYIAGAAAITMGVIGIIMFFTKKEQLLPLITLILGIFSIACGIILCIHPEFVKRIIPSLIGLFIIIDSIVRGISALSIKGRSLYWVGAFTLSIIGVVFGILVMVFGDKVADVMAVLAGVALIIDSIENFIIYLAYKKHINSSPEKVTIEEPEYTVKSSEAQDKTQE